VIVGASAGIAVVGTIGGLLVGVVGGGLVTWFLDRQRWKREDEIRWHPDRRQVYVRFLKAASRYSVAGSHLATAFEILRDSRSGSEGAVELVMQADEELRSAVEALASEEWEIELVASREVRAAATRVVSLSTRRREAEVQEIGKQRIDAEAVAAADRAATEARAAVEEFERVARAELGISE